MVLSIHEQTYSVTDQLTRMDYSDIVVFVNGLSEVNKIYYSLIKQTQFYSFSTHFYSTHYSNYFNFLTKRSTRTIIYYSIIRKSTYNSIHIVSITFVDSKENAISATQITKNVL